MLEIQRTSLKQFLTISLTVHNKFLDSCFLFKSSIQGERYHECIAWKVEKWYPKAGSYLYGDTAAILWVFFLVNKFIGWVLTHMFGEKHSEGSYVGSLTTGWLTTILQACWPHQFHIYLSFQDALMVTSKKSHINPSTMIWNLNLDLIIGATKRSKFFSTFFLRKMTNDVFFACEAWQPITDGSFGHTLYMELSLMAPLVMLCMGSFYRVAIYSCGYDSWNSYGYMGLQHHFFLLHYSQIAISFYLQGPKSNGCYALDLNFM